MNRSCESSREEKLIEVEENEEKKETKQTSREEAGEEQGGAPPGTAISPVLLLYCPEREKGLNEKEKQSVHSRNRISRFQNLGVTSRFISSDYKVPHFSPRFSRSLLD